jgi:hypothetical protein
VPYPSKLEGWEVLNFSRLQEPTTSKASRPSPEAGEERGTRKFKCNFSNEEKIKDQGKTTNKTKYRRMNYPSGMIPSVERSIVGSTDAKGRATRQRRGGERTYYGSVISSSWLPQDKSRRRKGEKRKKRKNVRKIQIRARNRKAAIGCAMHIGG